jgi:hypothetical protein
MQPQPNTAMPLQNAPEGAGATVQGGVEQTPTQGGKQPAKGKSGASGGVNVEAEIQKIALQLIKLPAEARNQFLSTLPRSVAEKVVQEMVSMQGTTDSGDKDSKVDMRPMPEQKPPRRNSLK